MKDLKTPTFNDTLAFIEEISLSKEATGGEAKTKKETKQINPAQSNQNSFQPRKSGSEFSSRNPKPSSSVNVKNQSKGVIPNKNVSGAHVPDRSFRQPMPHPLPMGRQNFDNRHGNIPGASQHGSRGPERTRSGQGMCHFCGRERHSSEGTKISWREKCPARNTICHDCKEIGHFKGMPACRFITRDNVIIIKQN